MSCSAVVTSVYPKDGLRVPKVMCIGAQDLVCHAKSLDADAITSRNLGCVTHSIITDVHVNQQESIQFSAPLSSLPHSCDHLSIDSVKIGLMNDVESVNQVHNFLCSMKENGCPIIIDLMNERWTDKVLQSMIDSILPLSSVLIASYTIAHHIVTSGQQSIEGTARCLLESGPRVVIVQDENGRRCMAMIDNEALLTKRCFWLPNHGSPSKSEDFSIAIAAYLAHGHIPLDFAILYGHLYTTVDALLRSSFLHIPSLTFTQELWSSVDDIYTRTIELPFLKEMLHSTLDERIYNYYIAQDYLFLLDRGRMLKGLVDRCSNEEVHRFFSTLLDKNDKYVTTILSDNNLPPYDEKTTAKMPACANYTKFMLTPVTCNDDFAWVRGLVTLLPCTLVYAKVGDWMIASGVQPTVKRYADIIDYYRDQARRDRLIYFLELTNRVVHDFSFEQRNKLKQLFRQVCEYEYAFWDESYRYGTQK
ncbi:unnamed protein product, partial [Rotaria socialis]